MRTLIIGFFSFLCLPAFSQKNIKVKKGKILSGTEIIAEYDGKGGFLRLTDYKFTITGDTSTLIRLVESKQNTFNPLVEEDYYLYELNFATHPDKKFYYTPELTHADLMRKRDKVFERRVGADIVAVLFNDTMPMLIENKTLSKSKVEEVTAKICFDYDKKIADYKLLEDTIGKLSEFQIERDKLEPFYITSISNPEDNSNRWYIIEQAGVTIGKIVKLEPFAPMAYYEIWKTAPKDAFLRNKKMKFIPIAVLPQSRQEFNNIYDIIKVVGKQKIKFKTANIMNAEREIVALLISNGML